MSGLYLIGVVALWLFLTVCIWRLGWRISGNKNSVLLNILTAIVLLLWFGLSFWYGGGRKFYYDWKVEQMCAVDGGIAVFDTVALPRNKFNKWGQVNFYRPIEKNNALGPGYSLEWDISCVLESRLTVSPMKISIRRDHVRVIRKLDKQLLGELITYQRVGGDFPGPWAVSEFRCPEGDGSRETELFKSIFTNGGSEK